ncbi:MAG: glycosyltransferase [Eubacterium sp.]
MNILLSAYSVNPYRGSEDAVGWNWTVTLSKKLPDSTIYLLTKKYNEKDTARGIKEFGLPNVKLIITDVPDYLNWFREKHSAFHHMYYILWQKYAYKWAKNSGIHFDIVHHVSMGNYRITGSMYKLENTYSIFGPVGGGQTTPASLRCYYNSQKFYEKYRDAVNKIFASLPSYKKQLKSFDKIYAVNDETKKAMEDASGRTCNKLCDIAISQELANLDVDHKNNDTVEIIYLGRFIELKGIMLLIDVIKNISSTKKFHVSLYGSGELKNEMAAKIAEYGLEDKVTIVGNVRHTEVSKIYKNADIFAHPTFRDSSGAVFVEAMAHKLPIVALNQSISRDLNKNKCGLFVNTQQGKDEIINEFASNLKTLIESYDLRCELGENGYKYANRELTLDNKFNTIYGDIIKVKE